ncbi:ras and Rab interactor 2 [Aulostomus maculatus]
MAVHNPINGTTAIPWRSSRKRLSLLEKLKDCQVAWCPGAPWDKEEVHSALRGTPAGSFLVVRDCVTSQPSLLCVSAGGENEATQDYPIACSGTVLQLSNSRLSFSDLAQLVLFYSVTRDVLDVCLAIPRWICSTNMSTKLSQLEPETWLHPSSDQQTDEMTHSAPTSVMCSIQLTSTSGALCIINPLYVCEHGDDWLTCRASGSQSATRLPNYNKARRLSSTRSWVGAGLESKRALSLDQGASSADTGSSGLIRANSADSPPTSSAGLVFKNPSCCKDSVSSIPHNGSIRRSSPSSPSTPLCLDNAVPEPQHHNSLVPPSPHRVSWIEDGVWLPPPRVSSSLQPPSLELDSLSISSIEEELEYQPPSPTPQQQSAHRLAGKVIHRLSAVGQALGGLVCQKKRLTNRVVELSERKGWTFAEAVKVFVEMMLNRRTDPAGVTGSEFLQEVRSSLTSLKETLLEYPEIQALLDSITDMNDSEIDSLVELSLHKVTLKPLSAQLYSCIHTSRTNDGTFQRLQNNQRILEDNGVEGLGGSAGVGVPDSITLERIQQRWTIMHEAYSPNKKVQILLKVCKSIYHSMSANASSGVVFGADDFLPCLTWVLLRSEMVDLQVDTDYMMELLDPTQLQGEGGYYLTTLYASLYYISSFQPRLAARQLSIEAQHSLNQWHRRRTLHCNQSRRSKHRRTIRRQVFREIGEKESETEGKNKVAKDVDGDEPQWTESSDEGGGRVKTVDSQKEDGQTRDEDNGDL